VERLLLCHNCYLRASGAAAATPVEANGFRLPSGRHADIGAHLSSGALAAHEERLLPLADLLQLEQLVAALPFSPAPSYSCTWTQVRDLA
jgi:hypothetical protein